MPATCSLRSKIQWLQVDQPQIPDPWLNAQFPFSQSSSLQSSTSGADAWSVWNSRNRTGTRVGGVLNPEPPLPGTYHSRSVGVDIADQSQYMASVFKDWTCMPVLTVRCHPPVEAQDQRSRWVNKINNSRYHFCSNQWWIPIRIQCSSDHFHSNHCMIQQQVRRHCQLDHQWVLDHRYNHQWTFHPTLNRLNSQQQKFQSTLIVNDNKPQNHHDNNQILMQTSVSCSVKIRGVVPELSGLKYHHQHWTNGLRCLSFIWRWVEEPRFEQRCKSEWIIEIRREGHGIPMIQRQHQPVHQPLQVQAARNLQFWYTQATNILVQSVLRNTPKVKNWSGYFVATHTMLNVGPKHWLVMNIRLALVAVEQVPQLQHSIISHQEL